MSTVKKEKRKKRFQSLTNVRREGNTIFAILSLSLSFMTLNGGGGKSRKDGSRGSIGFYYKRETRGIEVRGPESVDVNCAGRRGWGERFCPMKRDERAVIKTMMRRRCVPSTRELITSAFDYIRLASLQGDFAFAPPAEEK